MATSDGARDDNDRDGINREAVEYVRDRYDGVLAEVAEMLLQSEDSNS